MKVAIIKLSGKSVDGFLREPAWLDVIVQAQSAHRGVVIVHGAGEEISRWSDALNLPTTFHEGQRVTSPEVADVVAAVQSGLINGKIVARLVAGGVDAIGLSGYDRGLCAAKLENPALGRVGKPRVEGSTQWLRKLTAGGTIPVFSSLCAGPDGMFVNVNADIFAGTLAVALQAEAVYLASDIPGVIVKDRVARVLAFEQIADAFVAGDIYGGMIPKVRSAMEMVAAGISRVWIGPSDAEALGATIRGDGSFGTLVVDKKTASIA